MPRNASTPAISPPSLSKRPAAQSTSRVPGVGRATAPPGSNVKAAPAPISPRREIPSSADIQFPLEKRIDIGLAEQAGVARQRMFERGQRESRLRGVMGVAALDQSVQ